MIRTVLSKTDVEELNKLRAGNSTVGNLESELAARGLSPDESGEIQPLKPDDYKSRLMKYIPSEVIAMYLALDALIRSGNKGTMLLLWFAFAMGLLGTLLYLTKVQKVHKTKQLVISALAFAVWVLAIGGPFTQLSWYDPIYGGIALIVYTFFAPILEG
jgi:hypothetical protein